MNRNIFKEGSTYAGVALIITGIGQIVSKDIGTGIVNIATGVGALFYK